MKTMATAVAYNRLHNSSVGMGGMGHHTQLARSLERILEEAHFSGELILTNRKLKDFPKTGTKYDLTDTVIADLSRNRFCELPEEVTTFPFLETLLLYHNSIRSIPESLRRLTSLTYLDLRSNQLSSLPKEICFLPLQVLLVSNNRLTTLPDELGRMDRLTDLDVSYNLLTALPARIGELHSLRAFSLRNNQLMYLPRELSCLTLVSLDVANNRIASLPLEIRQMSSLVVLNLENNPLTSPPASLCVRGLVHVFKFLETQSNRDEKGLRAGGNYDGYTTLRRTPRINNTLELQRVPRFHADTGFNTCEGNDKRWSHDLPSAKAIKSDLFVCKPTLCSPTSQSSDLLDVSLTSSSSTIVDEVNGDMDLDQEDQPTSNSCSPDKEEVDLLVNGKSDKLNKDLDNIQTYKEYKEALKQQRNHEISSVYKSKGDTTPTHTKSVENNSEQEQKAPIIETTHNVLGLKSIIKNVNNTSPALTNGINGYAHNQSDVVVLPKKPIQKVIPSRNIDFLAAQSSPDVEKNTHQNAAATFGDVIGYIKPNSPMKSSNGNGSVLLNNVNGTTPTNGTLKSPLSNAAKVITAKSNRTVTWNHDVPSELLSFTMRREFDRQREETELMTQLRNIIETRLKMTLPDDIGSTLTDGVILCHLANYVRPRSVASIHVPSPGVSKLTMARCRRNVDNFLEACRKIGVDEELICSCVDVVPSYNNNNESSPYTNEQEMNDNSPRSLPNPSAVLKTVAALIAKVDKSTNGKHSKQQFYATDNDASSNMEANIDLQKHQEQQLKRKQQQSTATDTKEQIVMQINENTQLKSILKNRENNNEMGCEMNCEQIKKNVTEEAKEDNNAYVACVENSAKLLQCNNNNVKQYQLHHRLVNEKSLIADNNSGNRQAKTHVSEDKNQELPLCVNMSNDDVVDGAQNYQLLEEYKRPLVTKRIEFFEHSAVNTNSSSGSINNSADNSAAIGVHNKSSQSAMEKSITPKSSIFSIYRVADLKSGKTTTNAQKIILNTYKKKLAEDETSFIKHDSNVLTALLSCMFIGTFLLLIFFPLSG